MAATARDKVKQNDKSHRELLEFMGDYSKLLDFHIAAARDVLLTTVDHAMVSIKEINDATDFKLKKADEVLVRDKDSNFVSKSAREIDHSFEDPTQKVKMVNEQLSSHMSSLANLDESVRNFFFAAMGSLSVDDVVRQRLEHVSTAMTALQVGVQKILTEYRAGRPLKEDFVMALQKEMSLKMYKAYTMESEKLVFAQVFGDVEGVNQKS